jgi:S-layer protein
MNAVSQDYANTLFRSASSSEQTAWASAIDTGALSQAQVAGTIAASAEATTYTDFIVQLYQAAFGRAPESSAALGAWVNAYKSGTLSQSAIVNMFINSSEFSALYGANPTSFVSALYRDVLNRSGTDGEIGAWVNSGQPAAQILTAFVTSTEYQNASQPVIATWLATYAATNSYVPFVSIGDHTATPPPSPTFTLTTGTDNIAVFANNTTVKGTANGTGATFTANDSINGGNYTGSVLNLTDLAAAPGASWNATSLSGISISGIQTMNLTSAEAVTASTTKTFTGLAALNVVSSSDGSAVDNITVGPTTAVNITNTTALKAVSANLTVNGGSTVSITEANGNFANSAKTITVLGGPGTTTVSVVQTETGASRDQLVAITDVNQAAGKAGVITTVTLDGLDGSAGANSIADSTLSSLTINNANLATVAITQGAYTSPATLLSLALNNDVNLTLNDGGSKYKTLAITTGPTGSSMTLASGFSAASAETVDGAGVLTQTGASLISLRTLAVSGAAGLIDSDLAALPTLATVTSSSSGLVSVSLNAGLATFTGGSGQDVVTITTAAIRGISGGSAANNEIVLNNAATTWPTLTNVTYFSVLGVGPASSGTFDLAALTGFTALHAHAGTGTVTFTNVAPGTPLAFDAGAGSVSYQTTDSSGPTDSLAVTVGTTSTLLPINIGTLAATDAAGTGIGTMTITGYGATTGSNTAVISTLNDSSLYALTLNGSTAETIGGAAFTDHASTLTITNNNSSAAASTITLTDPDLTWLSIGGAGTTTVALNDAFSGSFTLNDTAAGAVAFNPTALANITSLTVNGGGTGPLTIGSVTDANLTSLVLNNTGSAPLTVASLTANGLTTVTLSGTAAIALTLADGSAAGALTITDNDSAAASLALTSALASLSVSANGGSLTLAGGSTSTAAVINLANTGTGIITIGGLTDGQAATVNLSGKVSLTLTDALAGTVTIAGAADDSNLMVNLNHSVGGQASAITLGNGNDTVIISDAVKTNTVVITIGSGLDSITLLSGHTAPDSVVFSAPNGASPTILTTVVNAVAGDTISWQTAAADATITHEGVVANVAAGLNGVGAGGYYDFIANSNTYIYENTGTAATSELVAIVGTHAIAGATTTSVTLS